MNTTPHYDLLPLLWWENPWTLAALVVIVFMGIGSLYLVWRVIRARRNRAINPLDQWLFDLYALRKSIDMQQCTMAHVYQELMRIMREYAQVRYEIHDISHTDEEFMTKLKHTTTPVAQHFLAIIEKIREDVYQAKFANTLFSTEHVQSHINDLIVFFEQEKNQSHDINT